VNAAANLRHDFPFTCVDCRRTGRSASPSKKRCAPCRAAFISTIGRVAREEGKYQRSTQYRQDQRRRERENQGKSYRTRSQVVRERYEKRVALLEAAFERAITRKERDDLDDLAEVYRRKSREYYARNAEKEAARTAAYKKRNPERKRQWDLARINKQIAQWDGSPVDLDAVIRSTSECIYCGRALERRQVTIDHIVPVDLGGPHSNHNLTGCCLSCNCRKRARPFAEWLTHLTAERRSIATELYIERFGVSPDAWGKGGAGLVSPDAWYSAGGTDAVER
jgi:5-methylcytosine-specific restriction endonuclease McrA